MLKVDLRTSRYQNHQSIITSGLVPVRTTLGTPRWKMKYELLANLKVLAPTREIFRMEDPDEFEQAYRDHLAVAGVDAIAEQIASISAAHGGQGLVLLCFEDVAELGEMSCHRRGFARWWEEMTGQVVPELSAGAAVSSAEDQPKGIHD